MTVPDLIRPLLSEYLDGELSAAHSARVESHLPGCAGCGAELAQLRAASQALRAARHEPSASAIHSVRSQFRSALEEGAAGGGWSFRLLPQLVAAGMAAVLLIAAGAIMIPRMSRHESQQAKNGVVYIRPEESGSFRDEKPAAAPASMPSAMASPAASTPAPLAAPASAAAPPHREVAATRAAPAGAFAPAPPAQPSPAPAGTTLADTNDERKKAKHEAERKTEDRQAAAAKKAQAAPTATRTRTAAAGALDEAHAERVEENDEPVDRTARYAVMPKVAIDTLWVRGAGGAAAAPATGAASGASTGGGTGPSVRPLPRADESPAPSAPAGAPPAAEPGLARRADCHPAPPEFPAFPGLHAGDADRLPITVIVTIDGGGHVIKVEPRCGPAQMPLASEIRNWLRGQRVRPMICNGEGVSATLTLTFTWPGE